MIVNPRESIFVLRFVFYQNTAIVVNFRQRDGFRQFGNPLIDRMDDWLNDFVHNLRIESNIESTINSET